MVRLITCLLALFAALAASALVRADPADIDAAARGVVRIVIVGQRGEEVVLLSHGTGFVVSAQHIVTNAHVVEDALRMEGLRIGVVPPEGDDGAFARLVSLSRRNDLALLEIVGDLRLPPLTLAGPDAERADDVIAVGYPMNVDRAQGLGIDDLFDSQPPVKARGSLAGQRPSRRFDTLLHTAPIARGNSGGPLLDACGRVLGVNSFGADAGGSDAEFYFAVSLRELGPFLRTNGVSPRVNAGPCRSLAELEEAERQRSEAAQERERRALRERAEAAAERRERAQLEAQLAVAEERENAIAGALIAFLAGLALLALAFVLSGRAKAAAFDASTGTDDDPDAAKRLRLFAALAAFAGAALLVTALALWFTRPGLDAIDRRVGEAVSEDVSNGAIGERPRSDGTASGGRTELAANAGERALTCVLVPERSRVVGVPARAVSFDWSAGGCVNGRTQYGSAAGEWSRLFVPNEEDAVSRNRFDPATRTYIVERYLLGRNAMAEARAARGRYQAPSCGEDGAADLGDMQSAVVALLPDRPNERLVYRCERSVE